MATKRQAGLTNKITTDEINRKFRQEDRIEREVYEANRATEKTQVNKRMDR